MFVYCGGYGLVDKEAYYCLNSDYQFLYPIETSLKGLANHAAIIGFYDLQRQPINIFPPDAFAEKEEEKNDDDD